MVTPAKAGVHFKPKNTWIPASAGMTLYLCLVVDGNFEALIIEGGRNTRPFLPDSISCPPFAERAFITQGRLRPAICLSHLYKKRMVLVEEFHLFVQSRMKEILELLI